LRFIVRQLPKGSVGFYISARRLLNFLFIEAMRSVANWSPALAGIMFAISDPKIACSVDGTHRHPVKY